MTPSPSHGSYFHHPTVITINSCLEVTFSKDCFFEGLLLLMVQKSQATTWDGAKTRRK